MSTGAKFTITKEHMSSVRRVIGAAFDKQEVVFKSLGLTPHDNEAEPPISYETVGNDDYIHVGELCCGAKSLYFSALEADIEGFTSFLGFYPTENEAEEAIENSKIVRNLRALHTSD